MFELYKFRWAHYHTIDKVIDIGLLVILIFLIVLFIINLIVDINNIAEANFITSIAVALFLIVICTLFVGYYRQGRFDQRYLSEMNEIRIKLKRKPIKDI